MFYVYKGVDCLRSDLDGRHIILQSRICVPHVLFNSVDSMECADVRVARFHPLLHALEGCLQLISFDESANVW